MVARWSRIYENGRLPLFTAVLLVAWTGFWFSSTTWTDIPTWAVTVLHEGSGSQNLRQLQGDAAHAGPQYMALLSVLSDAPDLRGTVRMNLWWWGDALILFAAVARVATRSTVAGLLLTAVLALNPVSLNGAFSELASTFLATVFLAGVVCVALFRRGEGRDRFLALGTVVLLTLIAGGTRIETTSLGLAALLGMGLTLRFGELDWSWLLDKIPHPKTWTTRLELGLAALLPLTLAVALLAEAAVFGKLRWLLHGINPLSTTIGAAPALLLKSLPLSVVLLALLGAAYLLRRPLTAALFPLAFVALFRIYFASTHHWYYEMVRHLVLLTPMVLVLASFGWRELEVQAQQRGWEGWKAPALWIVTWLSFVPPAPGFNTTWFPDGDRADPRIGLPMLLATPHQVEVRTLLDALDQHPECTFVARTTQASFGRDRAAPWSYVAFGRGLEHQRVYDAPGELDRAIEDAPTDCVIFYRGTDCNLEAGDDCTDEARRGEVLDERTMRGTVYNEFDERGVLRGTVVLGLYRIR